MYPIYPETKEGNTHSFWIWNDYCFNKGSLSVH